MSRGAVTKPQAQAQPHRKTGGFHQFMHKENTVGYVFIGLFIIGFFTFTVYPLISSLFDDQIFRHGRTGMDRHG